MKKIFGIGPEDDSSTVPTSDLIYPLSPFYLAWLGVTGVFLLYTAIFTPFMIAFYFLDSICSPAPTVHFDAVLDTFFLLDICVHFLTGIYKDGDYFDDFSTVAREYLKGYFWFDVLTSIPISYIELIILADCNSQSTDKASIVGNDPTHLRLMRWVKPLRWAKIARILKIAKGGEFITQTMEYWNVSPMQAKLIMTTSMLVICIHMLACLWWLFGKVRGSLSLTLVSAQSALLQPLPALVCFMRHARASDP